MRLLPSVQPEDFEAFLRDDFLPLIDKGPTRVGQVFELIVGVETDADPEVARRYLLLITWSGGPAVLTVLNRAGEEMLRKLAEQCVVTQRDALSVVVEV